MPATRPVLWTTFATLLVLGCSEDPVQPPNILEPPPNVPPALVGEWGESGSGEGQFRNLRDMVIDSDDIIYLADAPTPRVQLFRTDGTFLTQWTIEIPGVDVNDGPVGLALGPNGYVYELHNNGGPGWVARFTPHGGFVSMFSLVFGEEDGEFSFPLALAVDGAGNIYIADLLDDRIQKLDPEGQFLEAWTAGETPITQAIDLAWGPEGILFVLARQSHIHEFALDGTHLRNWSVEHHTPEVLTVDPFGLVYTSSQRRDTIERSTAEGVQVEWEDAGNALVVASDGTVLVGHAESVAVYRYPR